MNDNERDDRRNELKEVLTDELKTLDTQSYNHKEFLEILWDLVQLRFTDSDRHLLVVAGMRGDFEEMLDDMWSSISSNNNILIKVEYDTQIAYIKSGGCKVLRNPQGKHRIDLPEFDNVLHVDDM